MALYFDTLSQWFNTLLSFALERIEEFNDIKTLLVNNKASQILTGDLNAVQPVEPNYLKHRVDAIKVRISRESIPPRFHRNISQNT